MDDDDGDNNNNNNNNNNKNGERIFSLPIKNPKAQWFNEPYRLPKSMYFTTLCMCVSYTYIYMHDHKQPTHLFTLSHRACCRVTQLLYQLMHIYKIYTLKH